MISSGPHEFIAGSHRSSGRIFSKPYTVEEVDCLYGQERIIKIVGPKGTTFVADTWGVHRGQVPTTQPRLLLQIQYSILPIFKYNYRPVPIQMRNFWIRILTVSWSPGTRYLIYTKVSQIPD